MTVLFRDIARSLNHDAVAARRKLDRVFTKKKKLSGLEGVVFPILVATIGLALLILGFFLGAGIVTWHDTDIAAAYACGVYEGDLGHPLTQPEAPACGPSLDVVARARERGEVGAIIRPSVYPKKWLVARFNDLERI
jgi:hypothetical protein